MRNFIKYDLKTNKTYIFTILLIQLVIMLSIILVKYFVGLSFFLRNRLITDILFISSIIFFVGVNLIFVINFLYKDYFTQRARLTFSLPITTSAFLLAKILGLVAFYLISGLIFTMSLYLLGYNIGGDFIYYMVFGLLVDILLGQVLNLNMARTRFLGKVSWIFMVINLTSIIIPIIIITQFSALVLVDGALLRYPGMGLAFIFPFAIGEGGLYKIITPLVYYVLVNIIMFLANKSYIDQKLDLS
ncbi:hypothetical protein [Anaerococcus sp.]|uniref:hypothetical protein n=1 Tax=Anaerococcus sp. TaxID=1872515 RepID=UPI0027BADB0F|nr:hypothetical protein [Anaerococcus sp.]